jgi:hypothetical protein
MPSRLPLSRPSRRHFTSRYAPPTDQPKHPSPSARHSVARLHTRVHRLAAHRQNPPGFAPKSRGNPSEVGSEAHLASPKIGYASDGCRPASQSNPILEVRERLFLVSAEGFENNDNNRWKLSCAIGHGSERVSFVYSPSLGGCAVGLRDRHL